MKKIYSLIGAVAITASMSAQSLYTSSNVKLSQTKAVNKNVALNKTANAMAGDTTGWTNTTDFIPPFAPSGQLSIYHLVDANQNPIGYIYGKNTGGISTCAQAYFNLNQTPLVITGVVMWAAVKSSTNPAPTSSIGVSIMDMANNKAWTAVGSATTTTQVAYGPNTTKGSTTVSYANVDTASTGQFFTIANFSTPVMMNGDFAIVADCNTLAAADTVGWISDASGDAGGIDMTFHKATNGKWYVTDGGAFDDGALNNDIAFFAVLGTGTAVKEYYNGVKLADIYPNPAIDNATLEFSLEKDSKNVSVVVYDARGNKVYDQPAQDQAAGTYKISLNTTGYSAGTYIYQVRANGSVLTKQMLIAK